MEGKDYFVLTTNVDHQFQRAGFAKERLFYTQGDYGLFQSSHPTVAKTYDNQEIVEKMLEAQGFVRDNEGIFQLPEDKKLKMSIPTELIPICPDDGLPMTMNLRTDESFVENAGWNMAAKHYQDFLHSHEEATGQCKITSGYNLPAKYVLHTVGPIVQGELTEKEMKELKSCYRACLTKATEAKCKSLAFCCISTGVFMFPKDKAAEIAVSTVREWLDTHPESTVERVIFNVFTDEDKGIYEEWFFSRR